MERSPRKIAVHGLYSGLDLTTQTGDFIDMREGSIFSPEVVDRVLTELEKGKTLSEVCRGKNMPAPPTVIKWATNPEKYGDFGEKYARAREVGYQQMADELLEIVDDGRNDWVDRQDGVSVVDHEHVTRSRLRFDARRWLLSKALPKIYGDKMALAGPDGGPVQVQVVQFSARDDDDAPTKG